MDDQSLYDLTVVSSERSSHAEINSRFFLSKRNEGGDVLAGTHLIIMDDSSCHGTIDKSDPVILNYYRQLLIKGFD